MDKDSTSAKMQEVVQTVATDIATIRTGRATPGLVEDIMVDAYGGQQKLKIMELASITAPDTQTIVIDPWDKSIIGDIKKGILAANVGFNPSIDGQIIRISMPPLTTEDREKFVKILHSKLEDGRVMVRQIRGEIMRDIKVGFEKKEISEDDKFAQEKVLQTLTDSFIENIDALGKTKEKELLGE